MVSEQTQQLQETLQLVRNRETDHTTEKCALIRPWNNVPKRNECRSKKFHRDKLGETEAVLGFLTYFYK